MRETKEQARARRQREKLRRARDPEYDAHRKKLDAIKRARAKAIRDANPELKAKHSARLKANDARRKAKDVAAYRARMARHQLNYLHRIKREDPERWAIMHARILASRAGWRAKNRAKLAEAERARYHANPERWAKKDRDTRWRRLVAKHCPIPLIWGIDPRRCYR